MEITRQIVVGCFEPGRLNCLADQKSLCVMVSGLIQKGRHIWAAAIQVIQIQKRGPKILGLLNLLAGVVEGGKIQRQIMIDELPEISVSSGGQFRLALRLDQWVFVHHRFA